MDLSGGAALIRRSAESMIDQLLEAVDDAVTGRWEAALERASRADGATTRDRVDDVSAYFANELGLVGAATGGAAAVPAAGTAAAVAAAVGELAWTTFRLADLILTIAVLNGHDEASVEERKMWVLAVLAGGSTATKFAEKLASETGKGLGKKATKAIPMEMIRSFNHAIERTIVTKYGTKRGVIVLGTALPFGIGAIVGGGLNYATVRSVTRTANRFFARLPATARG